MAQYQMLSGHKLHRQSVAENMLEAPALRCVYTFWDYLRNAYSRDAGLRLDHFLLNAVLEDRLISAGVDKDVRGCPHSSDHAPAWIELKNI
jgi:exonuclease III